MKVTSPSHILWTASAEALTNNNNPSVFPFIYNPPREKNRVVGISSVLSARLAWGTAQEATATLAAINYFHTMNATVSEVGLCPLETVEGLSPEISSWIESGALPLVGASPDGLITYPDGSLDVLEIKCTSPFTTAPSDSNHSMCTQRFQPKGVGVWHIPQLQLEILCAGPNCQAASVITLSAFDGAFIYRIKRDDDYITELLYWTQEFYVNYCNSSQATYPLLNFFSPDTPRYAAFLNSTRRIANEAKLIKRLTQSEVQRSHVNTNVFV
jgi:hypothetical protein